MKSMHSCGKYFAAVILVLTSIDVRAQADLKADTPPSSDAAPTVGSAVAVRYMALAGQEERVSKSPAATADDFRVVINRYWSFVRRYPSSGFADNALWQAAGLSAAAFERFNQERDKHRAVQLFQWLRDQYPYSRLRADTLGQIARLESGTSPVDRATPAVAREGLSDEVSAQDLKADTPPSSDAAPTVGSAVAVRYMVLAGQEERVSKSPAATADDFRIVINRFWSFVRRYPASGFADNALWQAAGLSAAAFERFNQEPDKRRAVQLFQWLRDQYPYSRLRADTLDQIARLEAVAPTVTTTVVPASLPSAADTTLRAVYREVLPDVVRVIVELDREVAFHQEALDGPARLFFDLKGTKTVASLVDKTFRYDSDIVRHIRLGRHPNSTTRVVLDLENVPRYSVFTLYNPYRIVIDAERAAPASSLPPPMATAAKPAAVVAKDRETAGTRSAPAAPAPAPPPPVIVSSPVAPVVARPAHIASPSAPTSHIATADKTADRPALSAPSAPVAPAPPVIAGKPLAPSANSSGKFSVARQLGLGVSRIVIDAGHGGHDPGASANGISEAELVLDVSLRLEKLLLEQPGMEVVLTRRTNEYVSLDERTEIANRESADLFLSVHANASANGTARGVETYFLNFALNPQAEAVAARENAASGKTMNSLPGIIKAITLNSKLNESRDFAASIQRSLVRGMRGGNKSLKDLGVKQAPFMVLIGAAMPSVLAEISFVTNQQEARLLKLPRYRERIAEALLAGILKYQQSLKKVQTAALE